MTYSITIKRSAQKSLASIAPPFREKIVDQIKSLSDDPRPITSKKLIGRDAWRIRIGSYRVIYEINDEQLIVLVVTVGHRKDVYR